jgi:hypothetical protein
MSTTADAIQSTTVFGLYDVKTREAKLGIIDLLTKGSKSGYYLNFDSSSGEVYFNYAASAAVDKALAYDIDRFSSASFQSLRSICAEIEDKDSTAWAFIKLYYSAFYAGHALIRVSGHSCTWIDGQTAAAIRRIAHAQGTVGMRLNSGLYQIKYLDSGEIRARSLANADGGSHEAFWKMFKVYLNNASEEALSAPLLRAEAQCVFSLLQSLGEILDKEGCGASWLSQVRNEIQYRQGRGLWKNGAISSSDRRMLARRAAQWIQDPLQVDLGAGPNDLGSFVGACVLTVAICRSVMARIHERSTHANRSFAKSALDICDSDHVARYLAGEANQ